MNDISKKIASKFTKANRYANFGACVNFLRVKGFRGITCDIEFEFPVTAITGLNGAGKSTIGQLLVCANKKIPTTDYKRYYIKYFFPVSVLDPKPSDDDAAVEYRYQTSNPSEEHVVTISRAPKEWSGYKRQPEKASVYVGLTLYLPKVERPDLTIYSAKSIALSGRAEVENGKIWASRILGNNYEEVFFQGVKTADRDAELGMAKRLNSIYSENNMGFGEGRVIHTIRLLESCPTQTLVVLEEPETSLHEHAQYEFAKYLIDVSFRRGHQVVFSTHSSAMISALPPEGRKMLARNDVGVKVYDRISSIHIRNALTEGYDGHLIVCVEDNFARTLLTEIIRTKRPELLRRVKILPFGDAKAVKVAVKALKDSSVKAIGVRDGDQPEILSEKIYSLPGPTAPEKLVFMSDQGKSVLKESYSFDLDQHLAAHPSADHHEYSSEATKPTRASCEAVELDCIRAFLQVQSDSWSMMLIKNIESDA